MGARLRFLVALAVASVVVIPAQAQRLSVDQGMRAAGLWCFPLVDAADRWVYLPSQARLATDEASLPEFSFIRYVMNELGQEESARTIERARGGGVLHFLVLYETPEEQVLRAQQELRRRLDDDALTLRGPVIFEQGRYALVSSILNPASGTGERKLLATGRAPVLEGNRLALSFDLDPEQSTLLLESFRMPTPDVSLTFDMAFSGLTDAYDATMTVDWSKVKEHVGAKAGGTVYFVSADV